MDQVYKRTFSDIRNPPDDTKPINTGPAFKKRKWRKPPNKVRMGKLQALTK